MGRLAEVAATLAPPAPPRCKFAQIYETLDADDLAVVDDWLAVRSAEEVARLFQQADMLVSGGLIRKHRTGRCSCG